MWIICPGCNETYHDGTRSLELSGYTKDSLCQFAIWTAQTTAKVTNHISVLKASLDFEHRNYTCMIHLKLCLKLWIRTVVYCCDSFRMRFRHFRISHPPCLQHEEFRTARNPIRYHEWNNFFEDLFSPTFRAISGNYTWQLHLLLPHVIGNKTQNPIHMQNDVNRAFCLGRALRLERWRKRVQ